MIISNMYLSFYIYDDNFEIKFQSSVFKLFFVLFSKKERKIKINKLLEQKKVNKSSYLI